jgi:hypothetical protein
MAAHAGSGALCVDVARASERGVSHTAPAVVNNNSPVPGTFYRSHSASAAIGINLDAAISLTCPVHGFGTRDAAVSPDCHFDNLDSDKECKHA